MARACALERVLFRDKSDQRMSWSPTGTVLNEPFGVCVLRGLQVKWHLRPESPKEHNTTTRLMFRSKQIACIAFKFNPL